MEKWYSVRLIYQFVISGDADDVDEFYSDENDIFEESIILVCASSFEDAYEKAEKCGKENERIFTNKYHQTVSYRFIDTLDCYLLGDGIDAPAQVYSSIQAVNKNTGADGFIDEKLKTELDISSKHILSEI